MRIEQCSDTRLFYDVLIEFEDCFPHLKEKVSSLWEYAQKVISLGKIRLAIENEKVIALCAFYDNDQLSGVGYVTLIGVLKNYRKQQIGKKLLADCEDIMRETGMVSVKLEVDDDNETAKRFYECMGYIETDKASDVSHFMLKQL